MRTMRVLAIAKANYEPLLTERFHRRDNKEAVP
jgi:hypothetical protein